MLKLKKAAIYKAIAVVLCIFIAFEAHYLLAFQTTNTMREQFEQAKKAYFEEDYELARTILEEYVAQLDALEGFDNLKGETYLLLGAAYEALKDKEPAIKYYCLAKDILGQGATIEGIKLVKLRWYWAKCPIKVAGVVGKRKRKSTGAFIGVLVGLGIITGFFWYFFFSKNSPLKFETKDNESDGDSDEDYVFSSQCFSTEWTVTLNSKFEGGSGQVIVDPWPIVGPIPNENNEWYEVFTVQITIEGIQYFKSFELLWSLKVGGGDGWTRVDRIRLDGEKALDGENAFDEPCSDKKTVDYGVIFKITQEGTHDIEFETTFEK